MPAFLPVARLICPFFLANLISVLSEMIPKEIMKRGGILSRLAQFKEESPYKPESVQRRILPGISFSPTPITMADRVRDLTTKL